MLQPKLQGEQLRVRPAARHAAMPSSDALLPAAHGSSQERSPDSCAWDQGTATECEIRLVTWRGASLSGSCLRCPAASGHLHSWTCATCRLQTCQ